MIMTIRNRSIEPIILEMEVLVALSDELFVPGSESSRSNSKSLPVEDINNEWTYTVGSIIAAATGVVGISISTSTSTSIVVDDDRWTYTVRPFSAVAIDVVVGPSAAADGVVCISISVDDGGGWTRNAVTIVNRTWWVDEPSRKRK